MLIKKIVILLLVNLSMIGCSVIDKVSDDLVDSSYPLSDDIAQNSPIRAYVYKVNERFEAAGINNGEVMLDRKGRVMLVGEYENEAQIDKAFAIAQDMVGVRWVSPVSPSRVRVKSWARCLGQTLGKHITEECQLLLNRHRTHINDNNPPNAIAKKYALIVGVNLFKDSSKLNLKYPSKDATDIYTYLVNPKGGNIPLNNITLLTDEQVTRASINKVLQNIKNKAQRDDLVFVYFSSHGTPPDKDGFSHIVVHDSILPKGINSVQDKINAWTTSFRQEALKEFNQTIKAKRLVVILDTCYSGAVFRSVINKGTDRRLAQLKREDWRYNSGHSSKELGANLLGAKDIMIEYQSPMRENFQEIKPLPSLINWGKLLISSSGGGEKSWEPTEKQKRYDNMKNSVFTHFLLQALNQTNGDIRRAFRAAKQFTFNKVKERKKSATQTPQIAPYRYNANIILGNPL